MNSKSKWKGAVLLTLALVLALSLAVPFAAKQANDNEAEASPLAWGLFEGVSALGLPQGAGAFIDSAVIPGTNTVFVLCDQGGGAGSVVVYRSNDGGLSWMTPVAITGTIDSDSDGSIDEDPVGGGDDDSDGLVDEDAGEIGVAIVPSPAYAQDGTVHVLTIEPQAPGTFTSGTGVVYTSTDQGVSFPVASAPLPTAPTCMAADPNYSSLLSGGTITVGGLWNGTANASVFYETWQSPVLAWTGAWTAVQSSGDGPDTLALRYAPTSALRLIAVQANTYDMGVYGVTGSIITGFPSLAGGLLPQPGVTNDGAALLYYDVAPGDTTSAVLAIGQDYDPVSSTACPNCPMYMYIGTDDGAPPAFPAPGQNLNGSLYWFDPTLAKFVDLKAAATIPELHRDTSGIIARGQYTRAELLSGCANTPLTYKVDVRTMVWDIPVFIEGCGGPIGAVSNNVGVKFPTMVLGSGACTSCPSSVVFGDTIWAITTQIAAPAYGVLPVASAGDLTVLSQSNDFADTWWDTCLTQEDFRAVIQDVLMTSTLSGFIVTESFTGQQSVFKSPFITQWKRVDRWQGVQRITQSADGEAIMLLDTGMTGAKVLVSLDEGETCFVATPVDPNCIATVMMTAFTAGTANDIFVGDWNGHIYVTHDGGANWLDSGQVAAKVKSMDVPRFYGLASHIIAGVDNLAGGQVMLMSKDDGATWSAAGGIWGGGGTATSGHIEVKFSPMYNGATENLAYAGLDGTALDDMYRCDLSGPSWTKMALPGAPVNVGNFEVVRESTVKSCGSANENIMYVLDKDNSKIYATYYPELVSPTVPLWRYDALYGGILNQALGGNAIWGFGGPTPGMTNIPCPFDALVGGGVTLHARDSANVVGVNSIANFTETTAFLTAPVLYSPGPSAIMPSNNQATGEPVEYQWQPVAGAQDYQVMTVTDTNQPTTILGAGTDTTGGTTEYSIGVGKLVDGQAYFWKVRAIHTTDNKDHTGPWSCWMTYTIEAVESHEAISASGLTPAGGAMGISTTPAFSWPGIEDATGYEFELATDAQFLDILVAEALGAGQTIYVLTIELDEETSYAWRVRATGGTGIDAWTSPWTTAVFMTTEPDPPPPPAPTVIVPPDIVIQEGDEVTPAWIWVLIIIGAVLAVVVIVLIIRTRRPA